MFVSNNGESKRIHINGCDKENNKDDSILSGRAINIIKSGFNKVNCAATHILDTFSKIKEDSDSLDKFLRLSSYILQGILHLKGSNPHLTNLKQRIDTVENVIGNLQIFGDIDYFANGKYKEKNEPVNKSIFYGKLAFFAADAGSILLWMDELKFLELGKWAETLGKIPVLKTFAKVGLSSVVGTVATVGHGFFLADAINRLRTYENQAQKTKAMLDVANSVSEIALKAFVMIGFSSVLGIVALGIISTSTGLGSFVYGEYNQKELAEKKKVPEDDASNSSSDVKKQNELLHILGRSVATSEGIEKTLNVAIRGLDFAKYWVVAGLSTPFFDLNIQIKEFSDLVGSVGIFGRLKDWICPEKAGEKGKEKPFWMNPETTAAKIASRFFLTGFSLCSGLKFLESHGFATLGKLSSNLPFIGFIQSLFLGLSMVFSNVDNYKKLNSVYYKSTIYDSKIRKWEIKKEAIDALKNNKQKKLAELKESFIALDMKKMRSKKPEKARFLAVCYWNDFVRKKPTSEKIDFKVKKWKAIDQNNQIERNKTLLAITSNAAIGAISLIGIGTFVLGTSPVGMACRVTLGFATSLIGFTKFYYDEKYKNPLPVPVLA